MRKVLLSFICLILCFGFSQTLIFASNSNINTEPFIIRVDQGSRVTVNEPRITITGTANRDCTVSCTVNGPEINRAYIKADEKFSFEVFLMEGENKVTISAIDAQLNRSNVYVMTVSYKQDAPMIKIDQVPFFENTVTEYDLGTCTIYIDEHNENTYTLSGTMDMPGFVRVYINDDNNKAYYLFTSGSKNNWSFDFEVNEGRYVFYVTPISNLGIKGTSYKIYAYLEFCDITPPEITAFSGKNETVNQAEYTITGTISEPGFVVYKLNDGDWNPVGCDKNNNFNFTITLKEGDNDIIILASDRFLNTSREKKQIKVIYKADYEPPVLALDNGDETVDKAQYVLSGTLNEPGKVIIILNNDIPIEVDVNSDNKFKTNLSLKEGENIIKVVPVDEVKNEGIEKTIRVTYKPIRGTLDIRPSTEIAVKVNGKYIDFGDTPPTIINNRIMVPMRAIFEIFGAEVEWNDTTKTVTAVKGDKAIKLTINNPTAYINGRASTLDAPATIVNSRTLVPLRFISEVLDAEVVWEEGTKTVIITTE